MDNTLVNISTEGLKKELEFIKECLRDLEETYDFCLTKTSAHIGSVMRIAMQEEHEKQCNKYRGRISLLESLLKERERSSDCSRD